MKIKIGLFVFFLTTMLCNISFASELMSEEAAVYFKEAVDAQKSGNLMVAGAAYQKIILMTPEDMVLKKFCINNYGAILAQQGDIEEATAYFNAALNIDPEYKPAQINLGKIYEKRVSRLEALEYWAKVFDFDKLIPKDFVVEEGQQQKQKK